ncbi:acetolactate synthase [Methyloceanibacter stevinii]|uniref:Acetolactate synthase n=1 Tax=Methyloceanibacter stevinii TaxID=1774970 RepID=A0A1E3VPA8_9HYPH|nr:thiamine pyrophosphate-binding protein [Methyloceanibacter stevinii]ODR95359.1 acetolactate synthase [Methyloceanibacter stevinii]
MDSTRIADNSSAAIIARFLRRRGVDRVFALCGGHIMPIWMSIDAEGIRIIDVRDERAAVHMAHAHAELTGSLGVALVTAGPGLTNAITGIANAHVARAPVLVLSGVPPRAQENRGSLQDLDGALLVRSITRYARTVREPSLVLQELDAAVERAVGRGGDPGPVYLDFPTDTLRAKVVPALQMDEHFRQKPTPALVPPRDSLEDAAEILWSARRPLVISGRGARTAGPALTRFLDQLGALYLDTGESRGVVSDGHPSVVNGVRGKVMTEADVVVTLGRRLDFQLGFGSPAIFGDAKFVRISDAPSELSDNRRGEVEIHADGALTLNGLLEAAGNREPAIDHEWAARLRAEHERKTESLRLAMASAPDDENGRIHPHKLIAALQNHIGDDDIVVTDGGDFLSFCRVGLSAKRMLDPGSLGCIGIGLPFGIAAGLAFPERPVIVATGDGSFGFNAIEIDTAVRHNVPLVVVVANNGAWQIEVHDQRITYGKVVGTELQYADHAALARALGMKAERIESAEELPAAIEWAIANKPALLDVVVSPGAVSSDSKSGLAWVPDLQPLAAWDEAELKWRDGVS